MQNEIMERKASGDTPRIRNISKSQPAGGRCHGLKPLARLKLMETAHNCRGRAGQCVMVMLPPPLEGDGVPHESRQVAMSAAQFKV